MKKGTRWQYERGKGRRENKRKIGELEEKWGYEIQKEIFCIFGFLFKKMIKLLKLLWYHLSLVYAMYFIEADAIAEIEYKISLLLNHQAAHFDWPPAVNTLTLMNCFHLNNRALKFSEIKIFQTWIDSWLNESDCCFSQKDNHKDLVSPLLESRS